MNRIGWLLGVACMVLGAGCGGSTSHEHPRSQRTSTAMHASVTVLKAKLDSRLAARIVRKRALLYTDGADDALDRPAHVRAGSGLAWLGGKLAAVQDDANFIALIAPDADRVDAITLPAGAEQRRQFDDTRGNKRFKMDLEACFSVDDGSTLYGFGSGASAYRERIAIVQSAAAGEPVVRVVNASSFYAVLHATPTLAGSELNLEGAALLQGRTLRLFQRGVGALQNASTSRVNASGDIDWTQFLEYVAREGRGAPPSVEHIVQYDLGNISHVRLAFTDVSEAPGGSILYLACAEDTENVIEDGEVLGAAVGIIGSDQTVRWAYLTDDDGPVRMKPEGLALDPRNPQRAFVVVDSDQPDVPSELLEVVLEGPWL